MKKLTTEEFIKKAKEIHGGKYDYSKVEYVNNSTKVCIICPIHGEFWQRPFKHLENQGCPRCYNDRRSKELKLTTEEFVKKAKEIHGDKYDYSKVNYTNNHTKVCIICPKHGEFWQTPNGHLSGFGCKECANELTQKINTFDISDFIAKAKKIHGNKYDYSKVKYINSKTKVCIICPIHGEFWQRPEDHFIGCGCVKCSISKKKELLKLTTEEFIKKAKEIHGNKYDYSKVEYVNNSTKVCIICPKHGEFWQTPNVHVSCKCGCPFCKESHLEKEISCFLLDKIQFIRQKKFDWLGKQSLDFYLPQYKIAIECQGKQHFGLGGWHSVNGKNHKEYQKILERDERKRKLCEENGIRLLYYAEKNYTNSPYKLFIDKNELLNEILKNDT